MVEDTVPQLHLMFFVLKFQPREIVKVILHRAGSHWSRNTSVGLPLVVQIGSSDTFSDFTNEANPFFLRSSKKLGNLQETGYYTILSSSKIGSNKATHLKDSSWLESTSSTALRRLNHPPSAAKAIEGKVKDCLE